MSELPDLTIYHEGLAPLVLGHEIAHGTRFLTEAGTTRHASLHLVRGEAAVQRRARKFGAVCLSS